MTGVKPLVAFSALIVLAVLAGDASAQGIRGDDPESGFVIPGSKAGVNPAYHPWYFGNPPNLACWDRFETYDLASGTYLGRDGRRHSCNLGNGHPTELKSYRGRKRT